MAVIMRRPVAAPRMVCERAGIAVGAVIAEDNGARGSAGSANVALRVADWLRLAATPTFAVMALLAAAANNSLPNVLCGGSRDWSLSGMVVMYSLMSVFHSACWLKLASYYRLRRKPP